VAQPSSEVAGFMPWWVGDYLRDTQHLTRDQHGGYMLLLAAYWTRGSALPDDDARLAAIVKATPAEWRKLRPVLAEFFIVANGVWVQKRAEEEIAKAIERKSAQTARTAAATAARVARSSRERGVTNNVASVVTSDVTSDVTNNVATVLASTSTPSPSSEAKASSDKPRVARRKSPAIRLPDDWTPTAEHRRKAAELRVDCDREAAKMRAWAEAKDARNVRWDQAFSGWLLRASETYRVASPAKFVPPPQAILHPSERDKRLRSWLKTGQWAASWGPRPDEAGCCLTADEIADARAREAA